MVSRTYAEREIRQAFGAVEIHVGHKASETLEQFLHDVAVAVSRETERIFSQNNAALAAPVEAPGITQVKFRPRKRVHERPVRQAIRAVLARPDVHLPQWFNRLSP